MNDVVRQINDVFVDAGCQGWLEARPIGHEGPLIDIGGADPVVAASVYKLIVLVALGRAFDSGLVLPHDAVRVVPRECTPGPTGLSLFSDPVTMSWLDLARMMITLSDNAAADVILGALGIESVEAVISDLELTCTRVVGGTAALQRQIIHDSGALTLSEAVGLLSSNDVIHDSAAFDPAYTTATSAADINVLLSGIWTDTAASAGSCLWMRAILGQQIWPHRIRSGFPFADVSVAGKTGTIGPIRNEAAVVEVPGEVPIAVSVFTRAARSDVYLPMVDAAIGRAAYLAVNEVRAWVS